MRSVILPPSRHGVARIDDEIDDHLLELVEVGLHLPQVAAVHDVELDRLADQPAQQHLQFRQHVVELQHLRPQRLAAREGEQLPHQARRAIGVLLDLHDVLEGRVGRAVIGEQEVGIADDRGQHVVEVVRDAAGELADRLHLLALREILLQRALLGGVEREDGRARALVAARIGGRDEEARRARRPRALERDVERRDLALALGGRRDRRAQGRVIALGDKAKIDSRPLAASLFSAAWARRAKAALGRSTAPGGVHRGDRHRRRIEDAGEAHLGRAQVFALDLARRAVDHQRAGGAGRAVAGEGDLVQDAHRQQPALAGLEVDVELLRRHFARRARTSWRASRRRRRRRCRRA